MFVSEIAVGLQTAAGFPPVSVAISSIDTFFLYFHKQPHKMWLQEPFFSVGTVLFCRCTVLGLQQYNGYHFDHGSVVLKVMVIIADLLKSMFAQVGPSTANASTDL